MQRQLTWQKLLLFVFVTSSLGIGVAARTPIARAGPTISATIMIVNQGDLDLVGVDQHLDHGCWTNDVLPPGRISAHTSVTFESESCGVLTGTEGFVHYIPTGAPDGNNAKFYWDVPTTCCNTADTETPAGCTNVQSKPIDGGDHPDVTFTFSCVSSAGDGIADIWKLKGAAFDDGTGTNTKAFVNLPAMGANVNRKQIFLQIDWMQDNTHNQQLTPTAIKNVGDAFAAHGIDLIVDAGPTSINRVTGQPWGALSQANQRTWLNTLGSTNNGKWDWTEFQEFRDGTAGDTCAPPDTFCFKQTGRRAIFHYVIAAYKINSAGTSGISTGSDIAISLGSFTGGVGSVAEQSGTLMHELGHNLGLGHGGSDGVNWKPNYLSVMNYLFQMTGVTRNGVSSLDYSTTAYPNLNETALSENTGPVPAGATTNHWCPGSGAARGAFVAVADGSKPIDWNCNGTINAGTVSADVNSDSICVEPGANGTLETAKTGDDVVVGPQILVGVNRICDTAPSGDDLGPGSDITAFMPVGTAEPTTLAGADDWDNLKLKNGAIGGNGEIPPGPAPLTPLDDITPAAQADILPIDTTPPVTTESESATPPRNAAGWYRSDVTVTLSATDDISGVARTEYNLDGAGWAQYTGPVVISSQAVHTFQYRSIDRSQNVETAKSATIKLDKTAPTVGLTGFTPNGQNGWFTSTSAAGGVTTTDNLSGLVSVTCSDDLNGVSPSSLSPGGALSVTQALTITNDGVHHISCTATDVAGNSASTATLTVKVDSTPPACTAAATPNSLWPPNHKLIDVAVSLTATDAGSGLQRFIGVLASSNEDIAEIAANVQGLNVSQTYTPQPPDLTGPPSYAGGTTGQVREDRDGGGSGRTYTLTYTATDMAGNVGTCAATVTVAHDQGQ